MQFSWNYLLTEERFSDGNHYCLVAEISVEVYPYIQNIDPQLKSGLFSQV